MKKILLIPLLFITFYLSAAPIGEKQAREIAIKFFSQNSATRATSPTLELAWAGNDMNSVNITRSSENEIDNALIYIYNRTDVESFVIIAGDDNIKPIIAFSNRNSFDIENIADGARYLLSAWCKQVAAARARQGSTTRAEVLLSTGTIEREYETALWSQDTPYNNLCPVYNGQRSVTGCVATAMSIIAYYHKWPERGTGSIPEYTNPVYNTTVSGHDLGHTYDYANMLSDYYGGYTVEQGDAVARLMYDMGTSVEMMYSPSESGAYSQNVAVALAKYFGYSKGALLISASGSVDKWSAALKENIEHYGPTYFAGSSPAGGHAFILDGYTSADYFHINYGWGGFGNGYYLLPNIEYANGQQAIFYLEPDKSGTSTYRDFIELTPLYSSHDGTLLYRGISSTATEYTVGTPIPITFGGVINSGVVDFNGTCKLVMCDKEGNIVEDNLFTTELNFSPLHYYYYDSSITITEEIKEGDRLRAYYKGEYSSDWQMAKSSHPDAVDEIILKATPEEVAESLSIVYSKEKKSLTFNSSLAIQYTVTDENDTEMASGTVASYTDTAIDVSSFDKGMYLLSFASGGSAYCLTIIL